MGAYAGTQFVGIDLHRRRSVIVRTTETGEVLEAVQFHNDVERLTEVMARAGEDPEVVLEATYGWYWAADALEAAGASVHLAHPLGVKAFEYRRVLCRYRHKTRYADRRVMPARGRVSGVGPGQRADPGGGCRHNHRLSRNASSPSVGW